MPVVQLRKYLGSAPLRMFNDEFGEAGVCNLVGVHPEVAYGHGVIGNLILEDTGEAHGVPTRQLRKVGRCCSHAKCPASHEHRRVL